MDSSLIVATLTLSYFAAAVRFAVAKEFLCFSLPVKRYVGVATSLTLLFGGIALAAYVWIVFSAQQNPLQVTSLLQGAILAAGLMSLSSPAEPRSKRIAHGIAFFILALLPVRALWQMRVFGLLMVDWVWALIPVYPALFAVLLFGGAALTAGAIAGHSTNLRKAVLAILKVLIILIGTIAVMLGVIFRSAFPS